MWRKGGRQELDLPDRFPNCQLGRLLLYRGVGESGVLGDIVEINLRT